MDSLRWSFINSLRFIVLFVCFFYLLGNGDTVETTNQYKETILAYLDLAKQSIFKAKSIYAQNESDETSSLCASDKYMGFLNVAVNLVTEAEKRVEASEFVTPSIGVDIGPIKQPSQGRPIDCGAILSRGIRSSGEYNIWPRNSVLNGRSIRVYCDMDTANGGWTVIQRRGNFSKQEDFYVGWQKYKVGFGNVSRDFWLGNENIFAISNQGVYQIRFDLEDCDGNRAYAVYDTFRIDDENSKYKLHIEDYSGNAGDAMYLSDGDKFSTMDNNNDQSRSGIPCTKMRHGAWWYSYCALANLNGLHKPCTDNDWHNVYWSKWKDNLYNLAAVEIKVKRK